MELLLTTLKIIIVIVKIIATLVDVETGFRTNSDYSSQSNKAVANSSSNVTGANASNVDGYWSSTSV